MEHYIDVLKERLVYLGGEVSEFGYSTPETSEGPTVYDYELMSLRSSYDAKLEELRASCAGNDALYVKGYKALNAEYQVKKEEISKKLDKYHDGYKAYAEARRIIDVLVAVDKMAKCKVFVDGRVTNESLEALLVENGGVVSGRGKQKKYAVENTPDKVKTLELAIQKLIEEVGSLGISDVVAANKIKTIKKLKKELTDVIMEHPEYAKQRTIVEALNALEELNRYMTKEVVM